MLQDFANGTSYLGKPAFQRLQDLYDAWAAAESKERKTTRHVWKKVTDAYGQAHQSSCANFHTQIQDMQWEGTGFYREAFDVITAPGKKVPPLPSGPRWLVALEMWSRLQETQSGNYRLFISRDSRKHAWRRSLCNPWHQGFGWKARKPLPKKMKQGKRVENTRVFQGYTSPWDDSERRYEIPAPPRARGVQTTGVEGKATPAKPRVGIWS